MSRVSDYFESTIAQYVTRLLHSTLPVLCFSQSVRISLASDGVGETLTIHRPTDAVRAT